ncbi:SH3 domain-containing protein [Tabrizicola thermarum]|uniref:SH3 domain-containing protein n=1 Tax=Tabrizicola thermarum TaxID=2670345 RepID=UPI000FFB1593|nr:SH3 domain-containing protein [Tabrizicola thermarum]
MLRLTLILCAVLFAALMIAGEDRGQLRPGLADAAARKALAESDSVPPAPQPEAVTVIAAEPMANPVTRPTAQAAAPVVTRAEPEPYVEPARKLVTEVQEPIFSLSSLGTEPVPAAPGPETTPEVAEGGTGTIWYVTADSVNVRAEPSTEGEVLGTLGSGEAALLVQAVNGEWARIVIQGDGVEGYVAMRYLSPVAP